MRGTMCLAVMLMLVALVLGGCYMVPAPPPSQTGAIPPLPAYAQAMRCPWHYGHGWGGWGWYALC